jgi:DNA-binding CsgD family transcriptional regulator
MLGAMVHAEHGRQFHIVVQKKREFELDDIRLYRRLAPHLQRAVQLNLKLARLEMRCKTSADNRHPVPPAARIRQRYGLTPAEAAFAREIIKGDGIQTCADRLGISRATARTHLSHIFSKTEVRRQAELVRLLMQM